MTTSPVRSPRRSAREDGAVVVEFAVVFVLFVTLLAGLIQYGVIFAVQQSLSHAAAEATRAVVNMEDANDSGSAQDEATVRVAEVVQDQLDWLDDSVDTDPSHRVGYEIVFTGCPECIEVTVSYNWGNDALVPTLINLATPSMLTATANARWQ